MMQAQGLRNDLSTPTANTAESALSKEMPRDTRVWKSLERRARGTSVIATMPFRSRALANAHLGAIGRTPTGCPP